MRRTRLASLLLPLLTAGVLAGPPGQAALPGALPGAVPTTTTAAPAPAPAPVPAPAAPRGTPGSWTKISAGPASTGSTTFSASLYRTADQVLHVVYPRSLGASGEQIGHTAVRANGTTALQNDVLPSPWSIVESTPTVIGDGAGGLRVVFGGQQSTSPGFWSFGKMYTLTAAASGASWTLPAESVGQSTSAYGSYGTSATTLSDGTPVAAFPLNSDLTWHTGTSGDPDQSFAVAACCVYDTAMVRSGSEVWLAWYANGGTSSTQGTFVRRIAPSLGPILKAPGSSVGASSVPTERVALAARAGGGVYLAYCGGYPTCSKIKLWKVGTDRTTDVPSTRYATRIGLSAAPSGRLWLTWANNIPTIQAVRTNKAATKLGAIRKVGMPPGKDAVFFVGIDGGTGRGDVVINVGDGFWHSQVIAGLTLKASPTSWRHGQSKRVTFTVTDAGEKVGGSLVTVGSRRCTTGAAGTCRITFPATTRAGRLTARATKASYGAATRTLRVT